MDMREVLQQAHEAARDSLQPPPEGFTPMCSLVFENTMIPCLLSGLGRGEFSGAVKMAVSMVMGQVRPSIENEMGIALGPLKAVIVHSDSYLESIEVPGAGEDFSAEHVAQGSLLTLEERFKAGDRAVKECLTSLIVSPNESMQIFHVYRYLPSEGYEWEEQTSVESVTDERWTWETLTSEVS